ncbi:MAG: EAL domain-containing protein [Burkholderiaceae bacterium]|nr:EAL domain-containing protein [Burkholderiaceae bacterium]
MRVHQSLAELARQVADGRIRPCADQDRPLLERSTFSLLDEGRQLLQQRAQRDAVSGLPNRKGLLERLRQEHTRGADGARRVLAVLEFDQVRMIGNACGGDVAERLTRELAQATQRCAGEQAVVASLRDDTLAVLLPAGDAGDDAANAVAHAVVARLGDHRFEHGEQRYSIGVNVGLAVYEPATVAPEEAIRRADAACAAAKAQGRNQAQVYEPDSVHLKSHESLAEWAGRIDRLLEGEGLFLRAQMVMPIGTDASLQPYYEVLLGIETEPGVSAEPMSFVPAVERLKRSYELDLWVMRQVLKWIEDNRRVFDTIGGFAINVSPLSLGNAEIVAFLHERLSRAGVSAGKLRFEITETAAIEGYGVAQEFIRQFRRYGCRFSLDDFGSGYTSYSHLKNLQTDTLKIDGSFVKDMVASDSDRAMVKSMHDVARSLGMRTVAEYVETPMILARLREIGVDYAQGYAIHKPCPISELAGF